MAKLAMNNIQPETPSEITLKLMQSLDSLKIKDYRDRGSLHLKVRVGFLFYTSTNFKKTARRRCRLRLLSKASRFAM